MQLAKVEKVVSNGTSLKTGGVSASFMLWRFLQFPVVMDLGLTSFPVSSCVGSKAS